LLNGRKKSRRKKSRNRKELIVLREIEGELMAVREKLKEWMEGEAEESVQESGEKPGREVGEVDEMVSGIVRIVRTKADLVYDAEERGWAKSCKARNMEVGEGDGKVKCYGCGDEGHVTTNCPNKKKWKKFKDLESSSSDEEERRVKKKKDKIKKEKKKKEKNESSEEESEEDDLEVAKALRKEDVELAKPFSLRMLAADCAESSHLLY